jgi:chromosomal replication initiation ATPase DnaA
MNAAPLAADAAPARPPSKLAPILPARSSRRHAAAVMLDTICAQRGVSPADVQSPYRGQKVAAARHEVAYFLRIELALSLDRIGQLLGGRTRATILKSVRVHAGGQS